MHLKNAWGLKVSTLPAGCTIREYAPVIFFNDYQFYENYYHFTYDALLPLYALLEQRGLAGDDDALDRMIISPAVQRVWSGSQDWHTARFSDEKSFCMSSLTSIFPNVRPVHEASTTLMHSACFLNSTFGLPWVWDDGQMDVSRPPLAQNASAFNNSERIRLQSSFGRVIRHRLSLRPPGAGRNSSASNSSSSIPAFRLAIVSRRERRRLTNELALVQAGL